MAEEQAGRHAKRVMLMKRRAGQSRAFQKGAQGVKRVQAKGRGGRGGGRGRGRGDSRGRGRGGRGRGRSVGPARP